MIGAGREITEVEGDRRGSRSRSNQREGKARARARLVLGKIDEGGVLADRGTGLAILVAPVQVGDFLDEFPGKMSGTVMFLDEFREGLVKPTIRIPEILAMARREGSEEILSG
jgi:hypothetical protein